MTSRRSCMTARLGIVASAALSLLVTSCSAGSTAPVVPGSSVAISAPGKPVVYAAVGASETVGVGADIDRLRNAWPSAFYTGWLPRAAVAYNFGISGETVAAALRDELPPALAVHPTLVSVWLNVDDLTALVTPTDFERDLDTLVRGLRQGGRAKVLVANMPVIDHVPLVNACLVGGSRSALRDNCPSQFLAADVTLAALRLQEQAYNAATGRVVARNGAILVDLHGQGDIGLLHPEFIDREDGFHPSDQGHRAVANVFGLAAGGP